MINKTKKGYKIKFSKKFYSEEKIKKGLEDFKEVLQGTLIGETVQIILKEENELIPYEFCNYVFSLTK